MVKFIGMVGQPYRNFMKMVSWSRVSEHLVNLIGISDQPKQNNPHFYVLYLFSIISKEMIYSVILPNSIISEYNFNIKFYYEIIILFPNTFISIILY